MDKKIKDIIYMFKRVGIIEQGELLDIEAIKKSIIGDKIFEVEKKQLENNRIVYETKKIEDKITLRLLNDYLKSKRDNYQIDRRTQIKSLLNELLTNNLKIIKVDIKDYYNKINLKKLKEIIFRNDNIYESEYIELLNKYFKTAKKENSLLPGLSPANILAEILGKEIDKKIKKELINKKIIYKYFRYVDDILIIVKNENKFQYKEEIGKILKEYNLDINEEKFEEIEVKEDSEFSYLGYEFYYENEKWKIGIVKNKVDKLEDKLKKVTGMYEEKIGECSNNEELRELDKWYYENLKFLFYYKVYKGYKGVYYTGFSYNYCELANDFKIKVEEKNFRNIKGLLNKAFSVRNNSPFGKSYYKNNELKYYIEKKKKLIFIDEKRYMSKGKLIKHIMRDCKLRDKEEPQLADKKYYEICNIYKECFEFI